ncbi:hypothetical protein J4226_05005 [Candidatus Pacearchaeota archaeon]|nr:hypothetical protein [Candidatus Pacearchaeota archaeon]
MKNDDVVSWDNERNKCLGVRYSLNLGKADYLSIESSRNISEGEDARRLAGKVWKNDALLSGGWNSYKSRGPC